MFAMRTTPVLLLTQALMVAALAGAAKAIMLIGIADAAAMVRARVVRVRDEGVMSQVRPHPDRCHRTRDSGLTGLVHQALATPR